MESIELRGANFCSSYAALAAGTTTTFSTTGATLYCIDGEAFTTSAATNAATPTTDAVTGSAFTALTASKGSVFVFCYDGTSTTAATAIKVVQGSVESLTGEADGNNASFVSGPEFPTIPDTLTPFGYVVTKVGASGSTWTFGSSNLAGPPSNVKHLFHSCMTLPARPQTA